MAMFRGTLQGQSGQELSRLGTKNSGIKSTLSTFDTDCKTRLYHLDGKTFCVFSIVSRNTGVLLKDMVTEVA